MKHVTHAVKGHSNSSTRFGRRRENRPAVFRVRQATAQRNATTVGTGPGAFPVAQSRPVTVHIFDMVVEWFALRTESVGERGADYRGAYTTALISTRKSG